jgi:hypothetical protein
MHNYFFDQDYREYFAKYINNYIFVQFVKKSLKKVYDEKIEKIYQQIYHPENINQYLQFGMRIDTISNLLDEKINNTMQNVF